MDNIKPGYSASHNPVERPTSQHNQEDQQETTSKYTSAADTSSLNQTINSFSKRSIAIAKEIDGDQLAILINSGVFSNDAHYKVKGDLDLEDCTDLTALPEKLSVKGDLKLNRCSRLKALPENLSVGGNLTLRNCSHLKALPENLSVGGDLVIILCIHLKALPNNLSVGGDLKLRHSILLKSLPDNLSVNGHLDLEGCTSLTTLSNTLSVKGDLCLCKCTSLTVLPSNLSVGGELYLNNCTYLTALPNDLSVGGGIYLNNCTHLTALPDNFSVTGHLDLQSCISLKSLPNGLSTEGDLYLNNFTSLTTLPNNLSVGGKLSLNQHANLTVLHNSLSTEGNFYLNNFTCLTALHNNLSVEGDFYINYCTSLMTLPNSLFVGGNLYLNDCTSLTALPSNLSVGGNLHLNNCASLTDLPSSLSTIGGDLHLENCNSLTALPNDLSVSGDLHLNNCTALAALPNDLSVGGDLCLNNCTGLTALPNNLSVGDDLTFFGCANLTSLPNWITTLGPLSSGLTRFINLENTGLSDDLVARLRRAEAPGMRFRFPRGPERPVRKFDGFDQAFSFWRNLASSHAETPKLTLRSDQSADLLHFLDRLTATAEYMNQATRPVLALRVIGVMELLTEDAIQCNALRRIHDAISSCDDRVILALNDLETMRLLTLAETLAQQNNDPTELKDLGRRMMILDEVNNIAKDHMKSHSWFDEVEVVLAYQIGLRDRFSLPVSTRNMIADGRHYVTGRDLDNAAARIQHNCTEAALENYLKSWRPWQKYQRHFATLAFDQLPPQTVTRIHRCPLCFEITDKMVAVGNDHVDYVALRKAYLENAKNPLTNIPLNWSAVHRLIEKSS